MNTFFYMWMIQREAVATFTECRHTPILKFSAIYTVHNTRVCESDDDVVRIFYSRRPSRRSLLLLLYIHVTIYCTYIYNIYYIYRLYTLYIYINKYCSSALAPLLAAAATTTGVLTRSSRSSLSDDNAIKNNIRNIYCCVSPFDVLVSAK